MQFTPPPPPPPTSAVNLWDKSPNAHSSRAEEIFTEGMFQLSTGRDKTCCNNLEEMKWTLCAQMLCAEQR